MPLRWFFDIPPPNLPRRRRRSHDSLPACEEGWGGGAMFKSPCKNTYQLRRQSPPLPPFVGSPRFARGTKPFGSPCKQGDKGTTVQHGVSEAEAVFPSEAGEEGNAGRTAVRPYIPLS